MKIVETFLCGKENNPQTCEDGILVKDNMVVVIDGVTAKGKRLWNGMSSGCFAKDILIEYMQNNDVEQYDALELLVHLDKVLTKAIKNASAPVEIEDYPRAGIILYNNLFQEVWSYGDCQCRIREQVHSHRKEIDCINGEVRANVLEEYIANGYTVAELMKNDVGRIAIRQNLISQFDYENKLLEYGYPVLNGQGIEASMIKRYKVNSGDMIILASDGYPNLKEDLASSEQELKRILQEDPLCFREYRSTKGLVDGNVSYDDRAFCRIEV